MKRCFLLALFCILLLSGWGALVGMVLGIPAAIVAGIITVL